jgi:hypothetical protein
VQIALILPQHRLGWWHKSLAESLSRPHEVTVLFDDLTPPYPLSTRTWLKIERLLYRERHKTLSDFLRRCSPVSPGFDADKYDVTIDLSERPQPRQNSLTIHYDGSTDSTTLINRLLAQQTPHLTVLEQGIDGVIVESWPAIDDKFRLGRGLRLAFGRCISLVERAVQGQGGQPATRPLTTPVASRKLPAYIGRVLIKKASKVALNQFVHAPGWLVALRNKSGPFLPIEAAAQHNYADPFLFARSGKTFLFVEDQDTTTKNAVISVAEVVDNRLAHHPTSILERPYHLSYPLVFAHGEEIFMLPETAASGSLELYRAVAFPWKWELECILIDGLALADATPIFYRNRWWLFATMAEHGTKDHDELFIFFSDKLTGPWQPHLRNPVKSDCRSARPAGRIVRQGDTLFRPAQDCELTYGSGLVWHKIVELSPSGFCEIEIARFGAPSDLGFDGLHHFEQLGAIRAIDVRFSRRLRSPQVHDAMARLGVGLGRFVDSGFPQRL